MIDSSFSHTEFEKHIHNKHALTPSAQYLREIVYGGTDGIVTTFAVISGFNGASSANSIISPLPLMTVLLFGFSNLFADAASMSIGHFLAIRANQDVYKKNRKNEEYDTVHSSETEQSATIHILTDKGFSPEEANTISHLIMKNRPFWTEFRMQYEISLNGPDNISNIKTSLATFISFIIFGAIPLLPYMLLLEKNGLFGLSIVATCCALGTLGILRSVVSKTGRKRAVFEQFALGGSAAAIAFTVGSFFRF